MDATSRHISYALTCVNRHTGPSTRSISLYMHTVEHRLVNNLGQPRALISPSPMACVGHLTLWLPDGGKVSEDNYLLFVRRMLERLPNLIYARLQYATRAKVAMVPLLHLKHLELSLSPFNLLDFTHIGAQLPMLETALFRGNGLISGSIPVLNVSACRHLRRLVLLHILVWHIMRPPHCSVKYDMRILQPSKLEASQLQLALAEVNEVHWNARELYKSPYRAGRGQVGHVCMPALEVIRCERDDYDRDEVRRVNWVDYDDDDEDDDESEDESCVADTLVHCLSHSKNFPALRSIFCGDWGRNFNYSMKARIPADLAGVKELIIATNRPLQLVFDSPRSVGERLGSFSAVGRLVKSDTIGPFIEALSKRGLTLSMAEAEQEHKDAPSQCVYIHELSAPQLSYEDAIRPVNAHVEHWGMNRACAQCGACYTCLKETGTLDNILDEEDTLYNW